MIANYKIRDWKDLPQDALCPINLHQSTGELCRLSSSQWVNGDDMDNKRWALAKGEVTRFSRAANFKRHRYNPGKLWTIEEEDKTIIGIPTCVAPPQYNPAVREFLRCSFV